MTVNQLKNPNPAPGDKLRDLVADHLSARYGAVKIEAREAGKKVDVYFEHYQFGKTTRYYLECKDYETRLTLLKSSQEMNYLNITSKLKLGRFPTQLTVISGCYQKTRSIYS